MQEANLGSRKSCVLQVLDKSGSNWQTKLIKVVKSFIVYDAVAVFTTLGVLFTKPLTITLR